MILFLAWIVAGNLSFGQGGVPSPNMPSVADLSIEENAVPSPNPVDIGEDVTFYLRVDNHGPKAAKPNIVVTITYNQTVEITSAEQVAGGGDFSCSPNSGTLNSGSAITCTKTNPLSKNAPMKDFAITVRPTAAGTLTQTATVKSSNNIDNWPSNDSVTSSVTVNGTQQIVDNADDLCYEEKQLDGFFCFDMGICGGGMNCRTTYPLRNISNSSLSDVQVVYDEDNLVGGSFGSSCGVEPDGSCQTAHDIDFGPVGFFGRATQFDFSEPIDPSDTDAAIWTKNFMSGSCFDKNNLYGTYVKNGVRYRGKIKPCDISRQGYRPFTLRYQQALYGNMRTVGNTILVAPGTENTNKYADCSTYIDGPYIMDANLTNASYKLCAYHADTSVSFPTTVAQIPIPQGSDVKVKWAGLYWQALVEDSYPIKDMKIRIKHSNANNYTSISYDQLDWGKDVGKEGYISYSAFANITDYFTSHGYKDGNLTVGDIPVVEGKIDNLGTYGAWVLVIVYEDPREKIRLFSIYDGWQIVDADHAEVDVNITGFLTPRQRPIFSETSVFAAEGDKRLLNDYLKARSPGQNTWTWLTYTQDQTFDSSIHVTQPFARNPYPINNQGIDIQAFQLGSSGYDIINPNQTEISFKFGSDQDRYWPSMIAFNTELYAPKVCYDYTYGQHGTYITVPDLESRDIDTIVDENSPLNVKLFFRNTENADVSIQNLSVSIRDINTSTAIYTRDSTYIARKDEGVQFVPDSGRDVGDDHDDNISIGTLESEEYFYTYYALTPLASRVISPLDALLDFDLTVTVNGRPLYLGHQNLDIRKMDPCRTYFYYSPSYGVFNVVHAAEQRNGNPDYYYNLPTQVVNRTGNFLLESMDPNDLDRVKNISTVASVEILDVSGFHYTNANCLDPNATVAGFRRVWSIFSNDHIVPLDKNDMNNTKMFGRAIQNAAFRIGYITYRNGSVITVSKVNNNYRIESLENIKNYEQCANPCADANATGGTDAASLKNCAECLYIASRGHRLCSRDNFAIRPAAYQIEISDINQSTQNIQRQIANNRPAPSQVDLAAGYAYKIDSNATDYQNNMPTPGYYTIADDLNYTWSPTSTMTSCADTRDRKISNPFQDGKASIISTTSQVGRYELQITDSDWTKYDYGSAYLQHHDNSPYFRNGPDCLNNSARVVDEASTSQNGCIIRSANTIANVVYTDVNLTLHPYRFDLSNITLHTRPLDGQNWSYMNNLNGSKAVAVTLEGNLSARGANNVLLSNYTQGCMAEDGNVTLFYQSRPSTIKTADTDTNVTFQRVLVDASNTEYLPNSEGNITFPKLNFTTGDYNGTAALLLYSSLQKDNSHPINVADINYSSLMYVDSNDQSNADGVSGYIPGGTKTINQTITYYYAKVTPDRDPNTETYWYRMLNGDRWVGSLKVRVYCDSNLSGGLDCSDGTHPFGLIGAELDPVLNGRWYVMDAHNSSAGLGMVSQLVYTPGATVTPNLNLAFSNGVSTSPVTIAYGLSNPRPFAVHVQIVPDPWLLYVPDENFTVLFDREMLRWKGKGQTGNVILTEPNTDNSHRINW